MSEPLLGTILAFAGNFAPQGWALCDGSLMSISQNTALFSILGTTYGGNGTTTFALPDLRGRAPVGAGTGPGLSPYVQGQIGGAEHTVLQTSQMPAHNHIVTAQQTAATVSTPSGSFIAENGSGKSAVNVFAPGNTPPGSAVPMAPSMISTVGGSTPVQTTAPYTCITYIIAIFGVFPSRN